MKRFALFVLAAALVAAIFSFRSAEAQSAEDLARRITVLLEKTAALESQMALLNQQMAELRGPIRVSVHGVEIRTGDFTVLASGRILLRSNGELELKGSRVVQN